MKTADGTSLGSDDGAGVALIMSIVKGFMAHGPLRVIFTADEEVGMTGALAVTPEDLAGVRYLINIDSEESDTVTVSTAADSTVVVTGAPASAVPAGDLALTVSVSGLRGGHSGVMIGENRCNAILAVAELLDALRGAVPFELSSFRGGTAENAIPTEAEAVIVLSSGDRDRTENILAAGEALLRAAYADTDPGLVFTVTETGIPGTVLADADGDTLIAYLSAVPDGVYTVSGAIDGLVESSSNLGILDASPDGILIRHMPRSSEAVRLTEINNCLMVLATLKGYDVDIQSGSRAWPVRIDSALVPAIQEIYRSLNGKDIRVVALHAGLESGAFFELKPDLDMASIGPDISDAHSPAETLYLHSIQSTWSLLEQLLVTLP